MDTTILFLFYLRVCLSDLDSSKVDTKPDFPMNY